MKLPTHSKDALLTIQQSVTQALVEDIGDGDVTANSFRQNKHIQASVLCREPAVLCGQSWFEQVFEQLNSNIQITWDLEDGDSIEKDSTVCSLAGDAQAILSGERTALNFLQTLSATATLTKQFVDRIVGTDAILLDTRKTIPGLRYAQKYAVLCGGGNNHRMGLYDAILIKENHITTSGSIKDAVTHAKQKYPQLKLEVEVENQTQLEEAIETEASVILLDNFSLSELEKAVQLNHKKKKLEASGNININNIREVAKSGIDFISIGAITKNIYAIDFSMRFE